MHEMSGGLMSALNGGDFGSGFAAGMVSSVLSSAIGGTVGGSSFATNNSGLFKAIMLASGGLSGGLSSSIAGGKFVDGFRQGIITTGLNHLANHIQRQDPPNKYSAWFKSKLKEIDQLDQIASSSPRNGLRFFFNTFENVGIAVELGAIALVPFTDGASMLFLPVGFQINTVGVYGNTGIDIYDGKWKAGFFRIGKHLAFVGFGKALKHFGGFDDYFIKPLEFHMNQGIDSMISPQSTLTPINYQLDKNYNIKY